MRAVLHARGGAGIPVVYVPGIDGTGEMLLGLEDTGGRMGRLGRSLVQRDEITPIDEHVDRLRRVTVGDVARVLDIVLTGPRVLAAVGPFEADALSA